MINKKDRILKFKINKEITADVVRLINQNGDDIGEIPIYAALAAAESAGMDLVEFAGNSTPPVCKIINYGKAEYDAQKKQKRIKQNSNTVSIKEIRFTSRIDDHDYDVKIRRAKKFLQDDRDKVSISVIFRGRELDYKEIAYRVVNRIKLDLSEIGKLESEPKLDKKRMNMVFAPTLAKK